MIVLFDISWIMLSKMLYKSCSIVFSSNGDTDVSGQHVGFVVPAVCVHDHCKQIIYQHHMHLPMYQLFYKINEDFNRKIVRYK